VGTLVFSGLTPGGFTLNILNYISSASGTMISGVDGTDDRLVFQQDQATNILNGAFNFNGLGAQEIMLDSGFFEVTAVPEPSTWVAGFLTLGVIGFTQRRRLRKLIRA
jgi:hypothetical protein